MIRTRGALAEPPNAPPTELSRTNTGELIQPTNLNDQINLM